MQADARVKILVAVVPLFCFLMGAAACTPPETGGPASIAAPSSLATGGSVPVNPTTPVAQTGPGASYHASGQWHVVVLGNPQAPDGEEVVITFTADSDGNLDGTVGSTHVHLTRHGNGKKISYDLHITESHP